MHAKAKPERTETIAVNKGDLVNAWLVLEKLAGSVHRIGSAFATPTEESFTPEVEQQMLLAVGRFVVDKIYQDANRFRIPLGDYLANDEAEALSNEIDYWRPSKKH